MIIAEAQCGKWNDGATAAGTFHASQIGEVRNGSRNQLESLVAWPRWSESRAACKCCKVPRALARRFPPNPKCASGELENMLYTSGKSQGVWWGKLGNASSAPALAYPRSSELPRYCFRSVVARMGPTHRVSLLLEHHFIIVQYDTKIGSFSA
jgi:hypothetical protein